MVSRPDVARLLASGLVVPRRAVKIGVPAVAAVALAGSAAAVTLPDPAPASQTVISAQSTPTPEVVPEPVSVRVEPISRSEDRVRLKPKPEPKPEVTGHQWVTTPLNVWTEPTESSTLLDVLDEGDKVAVSGVVKGEWAEIVVDEKSRWVHGAYLADEKPEPEPEVTEAATSGLSTAPCATGSDVESGLASNAIAVHRAVCAAFPEVTSYGGVRPGDSGEHGTGQALDIMITGSTGDAIAEYVRENASELGVSEVIWSQQIWTVERASEGWRWMEDRGSDTANHYDHVHVTVY